MSCILRVGQTLRLTVTELDSGWEGWGLAHGARVLLDGAVWPGDEVECVITAYSRQHGHWFARVRRIVAPGVAREPEACPLAHACGGCRGDGIPYAAQAAWKEAHLQGLFPGANFVPAPRARGYRDKVKWIAGRGQDGRLRLGFYRPLSHRFLAIPHCPLLAPPLPELEKLPDVIGPVEPYQETRRTGLLRAVFAKANSRGEMLVTFVTARPPDERETRMFLRAMEIPGVVGVTCNLQPTATNRLTGETEWVLGGADSLFEPDWPIPFRVDASGFSQAHRAMARAAVDAIVRFFHGRSLPIVDLYCGVGPISLALAANGHDVTGVEINPRAIALARRSSDRVVWHHADAADFAGLSLPAGPLGMVVNPPRAGLSPAVLESLARVPVVHLAYMSCNPKTLARDAVFLQEAGFCLASVTGFDMFPQTPWYESVALFERTI